MVGSKGFFLVVVVVLLRGWGSASSPRILPVVLFYEGTGLSFAPAYALHISPNCQEYLTGKCRYT